MNWTLIFQYVISGAVVSWPVFIAGQVIGHRKATRHVEQVTGQQTADVRQITDDQTSVLLRLLGQAYQQHAPRDEGREGQDDRSSPESPDGAEDQGRPAGP